MDKQAQDYRLSADQIIKKYGMKSHPEGGHFRETYRCRNKANERNLSTAIYFLLKGGEKSHFHRIKSDEIWHFYLGGPLKIVEIDLEGKIKETILGKNILKDQLLQYTVPAGHWFASTPLEGTSFSFVGCTVAPGFDFQDFELAKSSDLEAKYPDHTAVIRELCLP